MGGGATNICPALLDQCSGQLVYYLARESSLVPAGFLTADCVVCTFTVEIIITTKYWFKSRLAYLVSRLHTKQSNIRGGKT